MTVTIWFMPWSILVTVHHWQTHYHGLFITGTNQPYLYLIWQVLNLKLLWFIKKYSWLHVPCTAAHNDSTCENGNGYSSDTYQTIQIITVQSLYGFCEWVVWFNAVLKAFHLACQLNVGGKLNMMQLTTWWNMAPVMVTSSHINSGYRCGIYITLIMMLFGFLLVHISWHGQTST